MDKLDEALETLIELGKRHGRILSLSLIFKTFLQNGLYSSKEAIAKCLRALQRKRKIKPINFGVDIELLENIDVEQKEPIQSSLISFYAFKKKI